jgi:uncharacterized protein (TIGR00297 family)
MPVTDAFQLILIIGFLVLFSVFSYKKKLLDLEGVLIGNVVGLAAITYGPNPIMDLSAVFVFFILGEIASNYPKKKHEKRNIWNVVGNSLPALIMLLLLFIFRNNSQTGFLLELGYFGAISAALADTLSSEIGYYSKKQPVLITTLKKVPRGTDGGITLLGEIAALFGGTVIGAVYYYAYPQQIIFALLVMIAGLVGSNADSLAGALFETKKLLNNTQVNIIGSASGAFFCLLFGAIAFALLI